jgi:hypothetical protein
VTEPGSRSRADAYGTNRDPGVREFEEGVTEAYSYARLDRFISETGFDEIVPGIHDVRGRSTYPNVAPAALEVAEGLGDRTGLGAEEVLDRLNRVDHEEKWDVATDLMYESSDLPGMAADDRERDASKARIRDAMRDRFTDLGNLRVSRADGITEQDVRASSAEAGRAAIADANAEIDRMERSYRETGRILDRDLDVDDAPPTSASRVDRPTDRTPIQNPTPPAPTPQTRVMLSIGLVTVANRLSAAIGRGTGRAGGRSRGSSSRGSSSRGRGRRRLRRRLGMLLMPLMPSSMRLIRPVVVGLGE